MIVGAKSDVGKVRKINQDSYYIPGGEDIPFYLVADGMGGHKAGEIASQMAREIIYESFYKNRDKLNSDKNIFKVIKGSIEEANTKIYLRSTRDEECGGMGTTITLAYIQDSIAYIGHVGDSRAYLISDDGINQITKDHSYVAELLRRGDISEKEARNHPKKNMITRAVGSSSILEVDLFKEPYKSGDTLILVSDGVTNMLTDREVYEEILNSLDIQKSCEKIIEKANNLGGLDNSTIVAIKFK